MIFTHSARHQGFKTLMLCVFSILLSSRFCYAQSIHSQSIKDFSKAYAGRDIALLKPLLSPEFMVGIFDRQYEDFLLNMLVNNFMCDSILFLKDRNINQAEVQFFKKDKSVQDAVISFDNKGLIQFVDVFDKLYHVEREQQSVLVTTLPFEESNGSIILKCRINESVRELRLLFDTGADGMALSTAMGEELGLKISRNNKASVVGGDVQIKVSDNNTVHIGDFIFPNQGIALFDNFHKETDGIIGNTLLKKYIIKVDYDKKQLELYTMGQYTFGDKGLSLPIGLSGNIHLPITLEMGNGKQYTGQVFFDTGASYNLILFRSFVLKHKLLVDGFRSLQSGSTVSMGVSSPTFTGLANKVNIGEKLHTDELLISLMGGTPQNATWSPGADGSLGVGIIGKYNFTVNLLSKQIYFEPNSRYNFPTDFVLGDYIFHFDLNKNLSIAKIMNSTGRGERVTKINDVAIDKWWKGTDYKHQLTKKLEKGNLEIETTGSESVVIPKTKNKNL